MTKKPVLKIQKKKVVAASRRKRPVPPILGGWEFALREHAIVPQRICLPTTDVVRTIGDHAIIRYPPRPMALNPAEPPSYEDKVAAAYAITKDLTGTDDPGTLARLAEQALGKLSLLARNGSGSALWKFAGVAHSVGEALSEMTANNPQALAPVARSFDRWPMMRSKHPLHCDPDDRLWAIDLGGEVPIKMSEQARWKTDAAGWIAVSLYEHLDKMCQGGVLVVLDKGRELPLWEYLGPFTADNARRWWEFAWPIFDASYPHPSAVPELAALVPATSKRKVSATRQRQLGRKAFLPQPKTAGQIDSDVQSLIKTRFFHLV